MSEAHGGSDPAPEVGEARASRMWIDVAAYLFARLLLTAVLAVAIYVVAHLVVAEFPIVVAVLFAIVLAFPLGIWVFAPLRRRATASIAAVDARRQRERHALRARLRGEEAP